MFKNKDSLLTVAGIICCVLWVCLIQNTTSACPAGQYAPWGSITICANCPYACATCVYFNCTSCRTGFVSKPYIFTSTFICGCPTSGTFYSSSLATCTTCSGVISNCVSCSSGITGTTCATCATGYFYNATSVSCTACSAGCTTCTSPTACTKCLNSSYTLTAGSCIAPCNLTIAQCSTCTTGTTVTCTACKSGYYLSANQCLACGPSCSVCNVAGCITCSVGFLLVSSTCTPCATVLSVTGCTKCTSTLCTACLTSSGYVFNTVTNLCDLTSTISCLSDQALIAGTCQLCSAVYDPQCTQCTPTACTTCGTGFIYNSVLAICDLVCNANQVSLSGVCQLCSQVYDPSCAQCDHVTCIACVTGYTYNSTSLACDQNCPTGQASVSGSCQLCSQLYSPQCTSCTSLSCTLCQTGYFYNFTSVSCQTNPTVEVCGDGFWHDAVEPCDDGNLVDFDGCSSLCQVETDYSCLVADKTSTGASFCKFTKNFTITLNYIQKQVSSNIAHVFFIIQPSTFRQWSVHELQNLLNPVTIVDQATGTATVIPYNSLNYTFQRKNDQNQLEVIVDYGQSLENMYMKFNVNPAATNLQAINFFPSQPVAFLKINSIYNAIDLLSYSTQTYQFQDLVSKMSMFLGILALIFAFLGLICPVGKLIALQALAVFQLTFFTILQFKKIPPTFIGFKNLIFSNGYNDPNLFESSITQNDQTVFKLMGLNQSIFLNYNISFIVFFWVPFLIGLIGITIFNFSRKSPSNNRQITHDLIEGKETNESSNENTQETFGVRFKFIVFKRILLQFSLYGILLTGYLVWVSVFHTLKNDNLMNTLISVLIALIWIGFGYKFVVEKIETIDLNSKENNKNRALNGENSFISSGFGQFKEVRMLISKEEASEKKKMDVFYGIFMLERIIVSLIIVFFLNPTACSESIIAIYSALLIILLIINKKFQNSKSQEKRTTIFSHIFRNYVLRQAFNFLTIISIQIVFLASQFAFKSSGNSSDVFSANNGTVKLIPMLILCLNLMNLLVNIFLWVWQIKSSQIVQKAKIIKNLCANNSGQNIDEQKQKDGNSSNRKIKTDEQEMSAEMGKIMEAIILQTPTNSPFIGMQEKDSRAKFQVPKLQSKLDLEEIDQQNNLIGLNEI